MTEEHLDDMKEHEDKAQSTTSDYAFISNEKVLFILNKFTGVAPYSHEFVQGNLDPQILSGFISAMSSFMGEVVGIEQTEWKTEYGSDSTLLVEGGSWAVAVLAVTRETNELRSKLRSVVREFEDSFEVLRDADGIDGQYFTEFNDFVRRVFLSDRTNQRSVILKGSDLEERMPPFDLPSISFNVTKLI